MDEKTQETLLRGMSVSKGIAYGEACVILHSSVEVPMFEIKDSERESEIAKFQEAILKTRRDIDKLKSELSESVGESEASIFDAHLLVLEDVAIMQETMSMFERQNYNIGYCYSSTVKKFIAAFEKIDDPFIKERISDLRDVSKRVLDNMLGRNSAQIGAFADAVVLVSGDFAPSDFALVDKNKILAIVSEKGSQTSHTAILARSIGVPCVVGIEDVADKISSGQTVLIDGYNGSVVVSPLKSTLNRYTELERVHQEIHTLFDSSLPYPSETPDGKKFSICINISGASDITPRDMSSCDGVGLFRTENFFLNCGDFPDEETQYMAYSDAVKSALGKPIVIRTLDLGGDKNLRLMKEISKEENPFMGYRAIRFCLDHRELFMQQLRAILRASADGDVRILIPMICSIREVERARIMIEDAKSQLSASGIPYNHDVKVGVMIEVPSAAITTDIIARACDFVSIGTNDLIQYLLAVDRVNEMVAHLYEPTHPAVVRTLNMIVSAAHSAGIPVCVCGELAADPTFAPLLLGMGVDEFSMSPKSVSEIKFLLRKIKMNDAKRLRDEVLALQRSRHIISHLRSFHYEMMEPFLSSEHL